MSKVTLSSLFEKPFKTLAPVHGQYRSAKTVCFSSTEESDTLPRGVRLLFIRWLGGSEALFQFINDAGEPIALEVGYHNYKYFATDVLCGGTHRDRSRYASCIDVLEKKLYKDGLKTWYTDGKPPIVIDQKDPLGIGKYRKDFGAGSVAVIKDNKLLALESFAGRAESTVYSSIQNTYAKDGPVYLKLVNYVGLPIGETICMAMVKETIVRDVIKYDI